MPTLQSQQARRKSGSGDATRAARREASRLLPECANSEITPRAGFPAPPPSLKPKPCGWGYVTVPLFLGNVEASKATFGETIEFASAFMKVYIHFAAAAMDLGHPCCIDSQSYIAKMTGLNVGTVRRVIEEMTRVEIISVEDQPYGPDGKNTRFHWIRTALRPDAPPEFGGPDRDDPACEEPHRPAYLPFVNPDEPRAGARDVQDDTSAPARGHLPPTQPGSRLRKWDPARELRPIRGPEKLPRPSRARARAPTGAPT